jgi:hypothetical protein
MFDCGSNDGCCRVPPTIGAAMIATFMTIPGVSAYSVPAVQGHAVIRLSKGQQIMDQSMYSVTGGTITFNIQIDDAYYCVVDYVY